MSVVALFLGISCTSKEPCNSSPRYDKRPCADGTKKNIPAVKELKVKLNLSSPLVKSVE